MKIIIVGCGKVGCTIIENLISEGHDITAVDIDPNTVSDLANIYDIMGVCGSGTDCDTLTEAKADSAELLISVTGSDEFNMLSCFLARKIGTKHTIARIRNPQYNDRNLPFLEKELNLSMTINPELSAAKELANILKLPSAVKIETFSQGGFEMIELNLKENSILNGIDLIGLRRKFSENFLVGVVQRGNDVYIPDGKFTLQSGDKIGITAKNSDIQHLLKELSLDAKSARRIMILGATTTAFYLAKLLIEDGIYNVKIIDSDPKRCLEFSEKLPEAVIINGDGANQEILLEEGIDNADAFVALTGLDEENILLSYFASTRNVPKIITKINRVEFLPTAEKLGLDCIVSPRKTIADVTLRYARALQNSIGSKVETLYKIMDNKAEALEFKVTSDCSIINIPFKLLNTKPNILVAGIVRGRKTIIPTGEDMILPDDRVVVLSAGQILNDLSDIVKR